MGRSHDSFEENFDLLLLLILPIFLLIWFFKLLIKGTVWLIALSISAMRTIKISKSSKTTAIPSADDIDRYEEYDAIFDDED